MSGKGAGQQQVPVSADSLILRLRGLPYSATEIDVRKFLRDVDPGAWFGVLCVVRAGGTCKLCT